MLPEEIVKKIEGYVEDIWWMEHKDKFKSVLQHIPRGYMDLLLMSVSKQLHRLEELSNELHNDELSNDLQKIENYSTNEIQKIDERIKKLRGISNHNQDDRMHILFLLLFIFFILHITEKSC